MSKKPDLVFVPLGGTGEIGMNCNLYGFGRGDKRQWIMVDLGVMFATPDMPGIERIVPNLEFIETRREQLLGLLLTHGHEDHIGAVADMWEHLQCPLYATPFTAALLRDKLERVGLWGRVPLNIVAPGGRVVLGAFTIDYIGLTHSIAEPYALAIECGGYRVLHSGDWKIDPDPLIGEPVDTLRLKAFGASKVDALICDSTNALEEGRAGSEADVAEHLLETIGKQTGRVAVAGFASNVARLHAIGAAAKAHGRKVCLAGYGVQRIFDAAQSCGYLADFPSPIAPAEAAKIAHNKLLIICTGSQGEPRAALPRIVYGQHPNLQLGDGDCVIFSSRVIPGNERAIYQLQNDLLAQGVDVIVAKGKHLHVSGHPCRDELRDMYQWIKPRCAVPVHGETRHLIAHEALATEMNTPEPRRIQNGTMLRLAPAPAAIIGKTPHGRLFVDGKAQITDADESLLERRRFIDGGFVCITCAVDSRDEIRGVSSVQLIGIPQYDAFGENIHNKIESAIAKNIAAIVKGNQIRARQKIKRAIKDIWGKRPYIEIDIIDV